MQIKAIVTYICHTCGEYIRDAQGRADIVNVVFLDSEGREVVPPFPPDTTSHHPKHLEEKPNGE
jgi:hypothetical protein